MLDRLLKSEQNQTYYWQTELLKNVPHGFFTRKGGFSAGDIAALNCGFGANEPAEIVMKNRELVAETLGAPSVPQTVYQHHSSDVYVLEKPFQDLTDPPKADALVTTKPGLPIAVLTADCAPVLFADWDEGVIGAAHAGWRGAVGGVLENTVQSMKEHGATNIKAVIGPLISVNNYEVGEDFVENLLGIDERYSEYLSGDMNANKKAHFNLPRFALDRLRAVDVDAEWIGECTYANPERYYSYRYSQHNHLADYGRLISTIMLPI